MDRKLKITLVILFIILLSLISFAGIFVQDKNSMRNLIPDYQLGMDLEGYRVVTVNVSDAEETIYYDKDGNIVEEEAEDGTTETVPVNSDDILTRDNYEETKKIIEKRLSDLGVSEYLIRLNEENGSITVQLPENSMTDLAAQFLYTKGEFTIENEDGEVLLDNSNLKEVRVGYNNVTTGGTSIYLSFEFNEDSIEKFREITTTYVESTDEEGNDTSKKVSVNIDGSPLLETSFDTEIQNGILSLTMGTSSDSQTLNSYVQQASNIAILLNDGTLPIEYTLEQNRFIKSDLTLESAIVPAIVIGAIFAVAFIVLIIKYRKNGLFALISFVGYMAIFLIAGR